MRSDGPDFDRENVLGPWSGPSCVREPDPMAVAHWISVAEAAARLGGVKRAFPKLRDPRQSVAGYLAWRRQGKKF
jgi:hypothetical protein